MSEIPLPLTPPAFPGLIGVRRRDVIPPLGIHARISRMAFRALAPFAPPQTPAGEAIDAWLPLRPIPTREEPQEAAIGDRVPQGRLFRSRPATLFLPVAAGAVRVDPPAPRVDRAA